MYSGPLHPSQLQQLMTHNVIVFQNLELLHLRCETSSSDEEKECNSNRPGVAMQLCTEPGLWHRCHPGMELSHHWG